MDKTNSFIIICSKCGGENTFRDSGRTNEAKDNWEKDNISVEMSCFDGGDGEICISCQCENVITYTKW